MKKQMNETGMKVRKNLSSRNAKAERVAKESALATAIAVEDFRKTYEVEKLAKAVKTCRANIDGKIADIAKRHDEAVAFRKAGDESEYNRAMHQVEEHSKELQATEAAHKTAVEKLLHTSHETEAERDALVAAGNRYRARGCVARLKLIKAALQQPKKMPVRVTRALAVNPAASANPAS